MSPQLTIQQLEHAIAVYEKRVEAKKLEIDSYAALRDCAQAVLADLLDSAWEPAIGPPEFYGRTRLALTNLFSSKHTVATLDLEDLELNVKAMRQMRSGVVGASRVFDPFKPNQRH
jgi:hypothetical protein